MVSLAPNGYEKGSKEQGKAFTEHRLSRKSKKAMWDRWKINNAAEYRVSCLTRE